MSWWKPLCWLKAPFYILFHRHLYIPAMSTNSRLVGVALFPFLYHNFYQFTFPGFPFILILYLFEILIFYICFGLWAQANKEIGLVFVLIGFVTILNSNWGNSIRSATRAIPAIDCVSCSSGKWRSAIDKISEVAQLRRLTPHCGKRRIDPQPFTSRVTHFSALRGLKPQQGKS